MEEGEFLVSLKVSEVDKRDPYSSFHYFFDFDNEPVTTRELGRMPNYSIFTIGVKRKRKPSLTYTTQWAATD